MATTAQILAFIKAHGIVCSDNKDGTLCVTDVYYEDGKAYEEIERIPATVKAARDWLGY